MNETNYHAPWLGIDVYSEAVPAVIAPLLPPRGNILPDQFFIDFVMPAAGFHVFVYVFDYFFDSFFSGEAT